MKYHFNLHLISLDFSLYSYCCAYWLVKKEKKQAIVEVKKRNGIMCTIGGLGRHIGRQSTDISVDYRSTIGRQSTDYRSIVDR